MAEQYGIKETQELLVGVNELSIELVGLLKDGFQPGTDVAQFVADLQTKPDFLAKLKAAGDNVSAIPDEVKDLSLAEGVQLIMVQAQYVPKILEAAKK